MQQPFFNSAPPVNTVNDNANKRTLSTFLQQHTMSSTHPVMATNNPYLQQQKKSKIDYIQLPEKVKDTISESEIYSILLNYEHRLDVLLSEKKQHMRQLLLNNETSSETLRIYVTHQRKQISKTEEEWRFGIQGGIVRTSSNMATIEHYKFTNFLKSMIIELDRSVFSGGEDFIEWNSLPSQPMKDGFTFTRRVNLSKLYELYPQNVYPLKLLFHFKQDPPLYEISNVYLKRLIHSTEEYSRRASGQSSVGHSLDSLGTGSGVGSMGTTGSMGSMGTTTTTGSMGSTGMDHHDEETFTLNQILSMIWEYITKNRLYDSEDKSLIRCDELLTLIQASSTGTTMGSTTTTGITGSTMGTGSTTTTTTTDQESSNSSNHVVLSYTEILKKVKSLLTIPIHSTVAEIIHPIPFSPTNDANLQQPFTAAGTLSQQHSSFNGASKKDVPVQVNTPHQAKTNASIEKILNDEPNEEIENINKNIQNVIQDIKQRSEKMKFMKKFAEDPVNTLHALIDSQTRDLLVLHKKQSVEEARKSSFYKPSDWIHTALFKYLKSNEKKFSMTNK
ncbi:hypothetical protein C9374_003394 [Naegleria lovaniensis]|uniref:DM2 domain-containing protein n=1 Tax=Naegleria lovaniensis TaxID=51637 RepID=A0AA88GTM3_NAELO|nr:uncharacterized protein C9374_003394 [Naegleria lovaniensis]KAG2385579.1 hypothetical protein C9374_003394 [Naegleria lovaniensis]